VVASLTDILDGYMARKYQLITNFGKLLDPLADKLLVMGAMVMLVEKNRLPGWMAVIILGRELAITSLRSIAGAEGVVIAASQLGRWKNVFQVSSITAIILYYHIGWVNFYILGITLFMLAVLMTIWSGVDYTYRFWPLIIGKQPQKKD
jgi:CDP-diacylglycerol--glycerol-3-phosphate 3-phosphatidyltransferase